MLIVNIRLVNPRTYSIILNLNMYRLCTLAAFADKRTKLKHHFVYIREDFISPDMSVF